VSARTDVIRLLGATGPGAWTLAAFYGVVYIVIAFWVDGSYTASPLGFTALVLMIAAAVVLVLPQLSPLPHAAAAGVVGASVFVTTAGLWHLDPSGWHGWATWYIGASSYLAFTLALRGRFWWGLADMVAVTIVATHWSAIARADPLGGVGMTYTQLVLFGAGAFFALWLRRTADRIAAFQETQLRRASADSSRSAAEEERSREIRLVRASAGSALESIATATVEDSERREHLLLEAELRDRIRGRGLAVGPLADAARAARGRGASVALLDDLRDEAAPPPRVSAALEWAATRLARREAGDVTVRLTRADGEPVVTMASSDGDVDVFRLRTE
jgi:hypothetical protein